jgi:DNA mismatch repair protein MutS
MSAPTPMMAQYLALKAEAEDCLLFYRMGDFFELFFDDAKVASACLDIALTARGEHGGEKVAMCGVPAHSAEGYLARLIKAGHRVAIADQIETPAEAKKRGGSKALVERGIVRVVTAGTLTEEALLDSRAATWCTAIGEAAGEVAIAASEGPRGASWVWLRAGAGGTIDRLRLRSASYANWPVVAAALPGNLVPDFPLINKSFELCYACLDR